MSKMAGRELDALIAKEIFGDKYELILGDYHREHPEDPIAYDVCPKYSTKIEHAWLAAKEIYYRYPEGSIGVYWAFDGHFDVIIKSDEQYYHAMGDTAPEAICKAVLKVVGHEEE